MKLRNFSFSKIRISNTLLSILLLALLMRLFHLDQSFWLDEAAQAMASARPFSAQWQLQTDFQPPLFYYLVHFAMVLGSGEWWLRLLPAMLGVANVGVIFLLGSVKQKGKYVFPQGKSVGVLAAFLLAIAPYHIYYSQELRMYSLAALLASLLIYCLLTKRWFWHTLVLIACFYTFYLLPLMLVVEIVYLWRVEKSSFRPWLNSLLVSLLGFSFWVPQFLTQFSSGVKLPSIWPGWRTLSSPGAWKAFPLTYAKFVLGRITFSNKWLYAGLVLVSGLFVVPLLFKTVRINSKKVSLLWYWLVVPIVAAWLISFWVPVNGPWRLIFTLPAMYLLLAIGIEQVKHARVKTVLTSGVVIMSLLGSYLYYANPNFQREDWRTAVKTVEEKVAQNPGSMVTFAFPEPFAPYSWYASQFVTVPWVHALGLVPHLVFDNDSNLIMDHQLKGANTIYHFEYLSDLSDPERKIPDWLVNHGYELTDTLNFRGVGFVFVYQKTG